jgi:hypothetical protein
VDLVSPIGYKRSKRRIVTMILPVRRWTDPGLVQSGAIFMHDWTGLIHPFDWTSPEQIVFWTSSDRTEPYLRPGLSGLVGSLHIYESSSHWVRNTSQISCAHLTIYV